MTFEKLLSQMGMGTKLTERYAQADYASPVHDQHIYYAYEPPPPPHDHVAVSKHSYSGGSHKSNAAMSALTLLAFLFFLHILQQCLRDQMMAMTTPQVMIMTAGKEGDDSVSKTDDKLDKAGDIAKRRNGDDQQRFTNESNNNLMKINIAEHTPKIEGSKHKIAVKTYDRTSGFPGYISSLDEKK